MYVMQCHVHLFALTQEIWVIGPKGETKTFKVNGMNPFKEKMLSLCEEYNITKIHLWGHEAFLQKLIKDINKENKFEIEVN